MPVPAHFGVVASGGGASSGATFVTSATYDRAGSGTQVISFSGMSAGQLVLIWNVSNSSRPASLGWNSITTGVYPALGYAVTILWKVLTASDITAGSATMSAAGAGFYTVLVYQGPTSAAVVSAAGTQSTSNLDIPGYTKASGFKGLVGLVSAQNNASDSTALAAPGTMVNRISSYQSTFFLATAADILNPANYTNGSTLTWTINGSYFELYGQLVELT